MHVSQVLGLNSMQMICCCNIILGTKSILVVDLLMQCNCDLGLRVQRACKEPSFGVCIHFGVGGCPPQKMYHPIRVSLDYSAKQPETYSSECPEELHEGNPNPFTKRSKQKHTSLGA